MSWLIKIVVAVAVAGLVLFELGSPLIVKAQLDDLAHDAADSAAFELGRGGTEAEARAAADQAATLKRIPITAFAVDGPPTRTVHVTVAKEARSYVLKRFGPTKDWYHVTASASAVPK